MWTTLRAFQAKAAVGILAGGAVLWTACVGANAPAESLDPSTLPENMRSDYATYAQRCSKCHSLGRSLNSGITDEKFWSLYVERMRRQPGSGISPKDAKEILRFLDYYSLVKKREKESAVAAAAAPPPDGGRR
jgi:hypothetical protein